MARRWKFPCADFGFSSGTATGAAKALSAAAAIGIKVKNDNAFLRNILIFQLLILELFWIVFLGITLNFALLPQWDKFKSKIIFKIFSIAIRALDYSRGNIQNFYIQSR